ncbi:ABC transporter/ substrate binding / possibly Mndomain protein [Synechococcus sp. A15-28]|nr:ABC transporter/ substrate binding / possibly Mndomain protein [Synechococcus sp. A15-28]
MVVLAGVLTDAGGAGRSQLRDSDGFAPVFPRFHQRLIPAETRCKP